MLCCVVLYCIILYCIAYNEHESKSPTVSKNRKISLSHRVFYGRWMLRVMGSWYMWCLAEMLISLSENRKLWNQNKSKHWNYISQAVIFLLFCQQANCKIYQVFCLANLFPSNLNANVSVILLLNTRSTALLKNNSVSTLYELTDLSFHVIHLQDWRRLWLETKHSLKTFCGYIGKHVIRVGWSPMSNPYCKFLVETLHLKILHQL